MKLFWYQLKLLLQPYLAPRGKTVRYAFPAVALLGVFLGAAVINSQGVSTLRMEIDDKTVQAGQPVSLSVFVNAHTPVNAVDVTIAIPSEYLRVTGIETGESVITLWANDPYYSNGKVYLQGGTFRKGFVGDHLIATINAIAKESGIADIAVADVQLLAGDGSGSTVSVNESINELSVLIADKSGLQPVTANSLGGTISIAIITDIDGDGEVTLADISRFMSAWSDKQIVYDFSGDGKMTFVDFGIILADSFWK